MIIDAIKLYSAAPASGSGSAVEYLELSLDHASIDQSYIVEDGTGFDADDIFASAYGGYENDLFVNLTPKNRVLELKIRLNPQLSLDETPSSLRDELYKLILATRTGLTEVRLMNNGVAQAYILGRIKKFDASIFDPSPTVTLVIECDYPFFKSSEDIVLSDFETSFDIEEAIIEDPVSTAPHGFEMIIQFISDLSGTFIIQGKYGTTEAPFKIDYDFLEDDLLYMSSENEQKVLYVYRHPNSIQLMDKLLIGQVWPLIFPGTNRLGFTESDGTPVGTDFIAMYYLKHRYHFWGV